MPFPSPPPRWARSHRALAAGGLAAATLPFANGPYTVWLAPWIAYAALATLARHAPLAVAVPVPAFLLAAASIVQLRGVLPLEGAAYVAGAAAIGLVPLPLFLLDRWAARRLAPIPSTLLLPCAWVALEWGAATLGPFGSWGAIGYTQRERLTLLQLASVTGVHGVSFLVLWFASTVATLATLVAPGARRARWRTALPFALVLGTTVLLGAWRLGSAPRGGDGVPVALVLPRLQTYLGATAGPNAPLGSALIATGRRRAVTGDARRAFDARAAALATELLDRTEQAARDGARVAVWSEGASMVSAEEEPALLARAAETAARASLHLAISYLRLALDGSGRIENVTLLLDPSGRTLWRYLKAHPVPGLERCVRGDGRLPSAATPLGRFSTAICFDLDFPAFLRQAAGADLLLVPSDDWREVAEGHERVATFRAVELGTPLARATSAGLSHGVDAYGREAGRLDFLASGERTLMVRLRAGSVPTLHTRLGDLFPALATLLAAGLAAAALRVSRSGPPPAP